MPIYDPAGKLMTDVDLDADIAGETKPWRVPGTDPTGRLDSAAQSGTLLTDARFLQLRL